MHKYRTLFVVLLIGCMISGCTYLDNAKKDLYNISTALGIDLTDTKILDHAETHGALQNDGITFYKLQISDEKSQPIEKKMSNDKWWPKLPLTDHLQAVVYGGYVDLREQVEKTLKKILPNHTGSFLLETVDTFCTIDSYVTDSDGYCLFPKVEHGYYYFFNDLNEPNGELNLIDGYSHHFIIALYDSDHHILYYYKSDS